MVKLEQISYQYRNGLRAIVDISLTLPTGRFTVLVGASGVGKSTLLRIVAGLLKPTGRNGVGGSSDAVGDRFSEGKSVCLAYRYPKYRLAIAIATF